MKNGWNGRLNEMGYQTPKLDTRAAIFKNGKILLVRENNGKWSLPGGWVDVNTSVKENIIKETKEESGLDVSVDKIIAVQDRAKHNLPVYANGVCGIYLRFYSNRYRKMDVCTEYGRKIPRGANAKFLLMCWLYSYNQELEPWQARAFGNGSYLL